MALTSIQEQIFQHIFPTIEVAVDSNAEIQLALENHSDARLKDRPRLRSLFHEAMSRLLDHEALEPLSLIDLLTLMLPSQEEYEFNGVRFALALQVVSRSTYNQHEKYLLQRTIWRRCMLQDDWTDVNDTESKNDTEVASRLRYTTLYVTLQDCLKNSELVHHLCILSLQLTVFCA